MGTYTVTDLGGLKGVLDGTCTPLAISAVGQKITGLTEFPGTGLVTFLWADANMQPVLIPPLLGPPAGLPLAGSNGVAVNSLGDVAGWWTDDGGSRAFVTKHGVPPVDIHSQLAPSTSSAAFGINEGGIVVGHMAGPGALGDLNASGFNAWVYAGTSPKNLTATVNAQISKAWGINKNGQIVGILASGQVYVCNADGSGFAALNIDSGANGSGLCINNVGQIAGTSVAGSPFIRNTDGTVFPLGPRGLRIGGINSGGQVSASDGSNVFISEPLSLTAPPAPTLSKLTLADTAWTVTNVYGVDDSGAIIGIGTNGNGPRGVLLMPTVSPPRFHQASFVRILFGILGDGGGLELPGGRVPPLWGPNLTAGQRDAVLGLAINAAAGMITDRAARSEMQKLAAALVREAAGRLNESE